MAPASRRTQIYLTTEQRGELDAISEREGTTLAELIREAVDQYLERAGPTLEEALEATAGTMPDLEVPSRAEWDRGYG